MRSTISNRRFTWWAVVGTVATTFAGVLVFATGIVQGPTLQIWDGRRAHQDGDVDQRQGGQEEARRQGELNVPG